MSKNHSTADDIINNMDCATTAKGRAAGGGGGDHHGDDMDVSLLASFASLDGDADGDGDDDGIDPSAPCDYACRNIHLWTILHIIIS